MFVAHVRDSFSAAFYPRLSEWSCAALLILIGFMLVINPGLMADGKSQAHALMLMVGQQSAWAQALLILGGIRISVLIINGAWRRSPHLRAVLAFLSCGPLCLIALSFTPVMGISTAYVWVPLATDMINAIRAAGDARNVDHEFAGRDENGRHKQLK
jgi:hypothetical protein